MRKVLNISVSEQMAKDVKKAAKQANFVSLSEFFRALIRDWQEGLLLAELEDSRSEIKAGKGKELKSLKSLR